VVFAATATAAPPFHVGGRGDPVLLVVGPEADHELYVHDRGLAGYLARRGWSVWITHADDLGAAIGALADSLPHDEVALVGHGLGGTACLRFLADAGDEPRVSAVVSLGAPTDLAPSSPLRSAVFDAAADGSVHRWSQLALLPSPFPHAGDDLFAAAMTDAASPDPIVARAREAGSVDRHPAMDDVQAWLATPWPAEPLTVPLLVACAETDRMAPCEEAWRARDRLGGTFHKFGYMNLDGHALGHLDLVLADDARRRVFPVIHRFLRQEAR